MGLNQRKWEILGWISAQKPIEELDPPLVGTEIRFYQEHKRDHDESCAFAGRDKCIYVPPNDCDLDESDEPWPPIYKD